MFRWTPQAVDCNLCGEDRSALLFAQDQHGLGLHTVMCRSCGLIYLDPRPSGPDYEEFYRHWYHRLYPARAAFNSGRLGRRITAETARRRCLSYASYLCPDMGLLEAGPGDGAFLEAVSAVHPQSRVRGVDLSSTETEACRRKGLDAVCGQLEDLPERYSENTHVALFHVLEHALDPLAMLRQVARRLHPGGYLLLEVPNALGSWQGLGMIHLAHPYLFAPATLGRMLNLAGFEVVQLDALEEPLFQSSIRAVARSRTGPVRQDLPEMPGVEAVQRLFAGKLLGWRRELFWGRTKRRILPWLAPSLAAVFWERISGRQWAEVLARGCPPSSPRQA